MTDTLGGIVSHMPFLRFVIPELSGYKELSTNIKKLWEFIGYEIDSHEKELTSDVPKDLIDAFLLQIRSQKDSDQQHDSIFNSKKKKISKKKIN